MPAIEIGIRVVEFETPAANGEIASEPVNHESQECELIDRDVALSINIVRIRLLTRGRIQERQNVTEKPLPPARIKPTIQVFRVQAVHAQCEVPYTGDRIQIY